MTSGKIRKYAEHRFRNPSASKKEAALSAGYSPSVAEHPQYIEDTKGFQEVAEQIGLTKDFVSSALRDDIEAKPGNRVAELRLASELLGHRGNAGTQVNILQNIAHFIEESREVSEDS